MSMSFMVGTCPKLGYCGHAAESEFAQVHTGRPVSRVSYQMPVPISAWICKTIHSFWKHWEAGDWGESANHLMWPKAHFPGACFPIMQLGGTLTLVELCETSNSPSPTLKSDGYMWCGIACTGLYKLSWKSRWIAFYSPLPERILQLPTENESGYVEALLPCSRLVWERHWRVQ